MSIVLMFFEDVLKFLNRLGVRAVNDVTARVTAKVTADMDPAHMGAGLQVVQAVPFDQSVLLNAINNGNNSVMTHSTKLNDKTMLHVDTVVGKESDERKKAIEGEGRQRKKDIKGIKAEFKVKDKAKEEEINHLQKRVDLIEV